jgi:TonB-linked SusC/RagA family outer membrane protein
LGYSEFDNYRAIGNAYLQITPLEGLRIKGSLYGDYFNDVNTSLGVWDSWVFGGTPSNPYSNYRKYDTTAIANIGIRNRRNQSYTTEVQATYNTTIGTKHSLEITGIANRQEWRWGMIGSEGILYTLDENRYNTSNASNLHNGGSYRKNWEGTRVLIGYAGRASYKYDDKYYLDVTLRRDGSSRFAPGHRWGTFPAVAAAWRLTNERFMVTRNLRWLNDLKIRANWGKLGNELATFGWKYLALVNPGITVPNYSTGSGNGNGLGRRNGGAYLPDFANNELSWETVTTSGVGFDAVLFNNKVNLTVEYYNRLTSGIIQAFPAPYSAGIQNAIDINVGEVVNRGVEFSAGYNTTLGPVNLGFSGNFTTLKNEVTKLYNGVNIGSGDQDNVWEGYPINYIRGYKVGGIFQTQAEIDAWRTRYRDAIAGQVANNTTTGAHKPGDMWFMDVATAPSTPGKYNNNPDSVINSDDRVYLGKTIPGFFYGFGLNASFSNLEFSIYFRGQGDVQRINEIKRNGENMSSNGLNQLATVLNRWTPSNPSTTMPRAIFNDPAQNNRMSDRWVEDAGFMRLQNVELAYRIPASVLGKSGFIQGIRVYIMGTNLATFTNYSGVDPENDFNPVAKQIVFGLNASF